MALDGYGVYNFTLNCEDEDEVDIQLVLNTTSM